MTYQLIRHCINISGDKFNQITSIPTDVADDMAKNAAMRPNGDAIVYAPYADGVGLYHAYTIPSYYLYQ